MRLAYVTSHPIQYQAPLFRELARTPGVEFEALFCHNHGLDATFDPGFGRVVQFDVPLLRGYPHRFLENFAPAPSLGFTGQINPSIVSHLRRFDAAIFHGYASVTNLLGILGRLRKPAVLLRGESHLLQPRPRVRAVLRKPPLRALFARIDQFTAIGTLNRDYYLSYGIAPERITIAPYAVDNDYFAERRVPDDERTDSRAAAGLPRDGTLFLFCAKLINKKRPADAIRALATARKSADCHLAIIGEGPLRSSCEQEVQRLGLQGAVTFLGFRNQSELPRFYSMSDVLVLPSSDEPWGLVVNEAMASGAAVVASNRVGSVPDLVPIEHTFTPGDVAALARSMVRLTGRETLARARAAAAERIAHWGFRETVAGFTEAANVALDRLNRA